MEKAYELQYMAHVGHADTYVWFHQYVETTNYNLHSLMAKMYCVVFWSNMMYHRVTFQSDYRALEAAQIFLRKLENIERGPTFPVHPCLVQRYGLHSLQIHALSEWMNHQWIKALREQNWKPVSIEITMDPFPE